MACIVPDTRHRTESHSTWSRPVRQRRGIGGVANQWYVSQLRHRAAAILRLTDPRDHRTILGSPAASRTGMSETSITDAT